MDQTVPELLRQGLIITALGMGLVFAALSLLWGIMALLARASGSGEEQTEPAEAPSREGAREAARAASTERLTAERARVAAAVAGALVANAIPVLMEVPAGPAFEHGRTAPIWVTANRARVLHSWQPLRVRETQRTNGSD